MSVAVELGEGGRHFIYVQENGEHSLKYNYYFDHRHFTKGACHRARALTKGSYTEAVVLVAAGQVFFSRASKVDSISNTIITDENEQRQQLYYPNHLVLKCLSREELLQFHYWRRHQSCDWAIFC